MNLVQQRIHLEAWGRAIAYGPIRETFDQIPLPSCPVLSQKACRKLAVRRHAIHSCIYFYTEIWPTSTHPYLRSYKRVWSSSASRSTVSPYDRPPRHI